MLEENYDARRVAYSTAMKDMFKQITTTMTKALSPRKIPESYDINWWWTLYEKITKGLTPLRRPKPSKNHIRRRIKLKNYTKIIRIGMIGINNYIGTSLNGSIQ